jgi:Asp-tRNA(Asn)/Glu-tRNA(Gln) amidotransferase A subunit family amidase
MIRTAIGGLGAACLIAAGAIGPGPDLQSEHPATATQAAFEVMEKSIAELQAALQKKEVTSRQLVESYLARIDAYDQQGPRLNAFVSLNPAALTTADALDRERAAGRVRGPLHGIPIVVKDNFDTSDMPTTGSSIALATYRPARDAFQVARLRAAGAIVLGKTNLHELASGIVTVSSLGGQTRNPYDPSRNPGGSSGGTGAAVAANFGAAGLGTDTCGSIRIPASHNNLAGLRPTSGLSSRSGIIPLSLTQDVAGPLARSVRDVALLLDATAGADPADPSTAASRGRIPRSYLDGLGTSTLENVRLGVLAPLFGGAPEDAEVAQIVRASLDTARGRGAVLVDLPMPELTELLRATSVIDAEFKFDLADYLAAAQNPPVRSLGEILERGLHHQALDATFRRRNGATARDTDAYRASLAKREAARKAILAVMDAEKVTALVYPTIRRKPSVIGEAQAGANCQLSPTTGLPALSVPAGFTTDGLPVGVEFVGRPFADAELLELGDAFERTIRARRPPSSTPPLGLRADRASDPTPTRPMRERMLGQTGPSVDATFRQPAANLLAYDVTLVGVSASDVLLLAIHRTPPAGAPVPTAGYLIARLLGRGQVSGRGELPLREADREDLAAGRLHLRLFTRQQPFGRIVGMVK